MLILKSADSQHTVNPWCAIYTRHQHEKSVSETLEAKGFEVFLPLYESTRRWKDRQKVLSLPQTTVTADFETHRLWVHEPCDRYFTATPEGALYP